MTGFIAHFYNLLLHRHTVSSLLIIFDCHLMRLPPFYAATANPLPFILNYLRRVQLYTNCSFGELRNSSGSSQMNSSLYPLFKDRTENAVSNSAPIVVYLPISCLETGYSIVTCLFISAGTCLLPLPNNKLFQLSDVMSQHTQIHSLYRCEILSVLVKKEQRGNCEREAEDNC
jgi:hypothetical protein